MLIEAPPVNCWGWSLIQRTAMIPPWALRFVQPATKPVLLMELATPWMPPISGSIVRTPERKTNGRDVVVYDPTMSRFALIARARLKLVWSCGIRTGGFVGGVAWNARAPN